MHHTNIVSDSQMNSQEETAAASETSKPDPGTGRDRRNWEIREKKTGSKANKKKVEKEEKTDIGVEYAID